MKSKAKPVKGSARTKRFDIGGTVGALAGLGTLAYLINKKKKGAAEAEGPEYKPQGKFPAEQTHEIAKGEEYKPVGNEGKEGVFKDGMKYTKPEASTAVETTTSKPAPVVKKKKKVVATTTTSQQNQSQAAAPTTTSQRNQNQNRQSSSSSSATSLTNKGKGKDKGFGTATQMSSDSDAAKAMRQSRAQRLGATYNAQYKALQTAPEGPGKEALKKAVAKAKQDYEDANKGLKRGGAVKKYAAGGAIKASKMGSVKTAKPSMGSASKRADGIAIRGKTRA
jgi:hypothetical protein